MNYPQISDMAAQGLTPAQIAETLCLDESEVIEVLEKDFKQNAGLTLDELYAKHAVDAVKVLADIIKNGENDSARVTACKVMLTRGGNFSDNAMERLSERFTRMKEVVKRNIDNMSLITTMTSDNGGGGEIKVAMNLQVD